MNDDKTPIPMKSSDSGRTVEETKQVNLKINCTEEMLNKLAAASNYPRLITISYIDAGGTIQTYWEQTEFHPDNVVIALETLSKDLHETYIEPASRKPKIVPPPRRRRKR